METQNNTITLEVAFQRRTFHLDAVDPAATTLGSVKEMLAEWSGVPIAGQKLMYKGKLLANDAADLAASGITASAKLLLSGSSAADVKRIQDKRTAAPYKPVSLYAKKPASAAPASQYTFHAIEVLPLPQADRARAVLERLRDDTGVRAIMDANRWAVGKLIELSPTEHTILGYNRNKGQVIALRLRTDDFAGFRHFDGVCKVLLHELAHMVHSDHDEQFHALNRKLNKDLVELDWTRRGNRLDTNLSGRSVFGDMDEDDDLVDAGGYQGGTFVLGGGGAREPQQLTPREMAARAALARLTAEEEQEMTDGCGSKHASE
ncbi:hypothetical protein H9P43_007433 [Blastocladiella emersonii ATCC 22665]|nr:hypothetical protein H9P43_007433 [Blastocladiella emersonii ATCC 22665]